MNTISRDGLRERLADRCATFPVTLVCAPAGFGKTLLLTDWVEKAGAADKAWVSLDGGDDEPGRFWTAVLSAVCGCAVVPSSSRLHTLQPPRTLDDAHTVAAFFAEVVDGLGALRTPLYLVLDDLQEVRGDETWRGIATLVRHQPRNLRLILSTRSDPRLPLARLRLQDTLAELRVAALCFSPDEAAELLRRAEVKLDEEQVHRLVGTTGGWPAGLRLAAHSLRDVPDRQAFLAEFGGNDRAVADFLVSEVLARLPSATKEVLTLVSVCDEVTPALAVTLSGRADAGAILAGLERDNSLVLGVGPDRQWYRTHPLLRSYLVAELERQRPGVVAELHETAAEWFVAQERPDKALEHLTLTGENHALANLLESRAATVLLAGDDRQSVRRALNSVGADGVTRNPGLALLSALAHVQAGDRVRAETDLDASWVAWPAEPGGALTRLRQLVRATWAFADGRLPPSEPLDWADVIAALDGGEEEAWARLIRGWTLLRSGAVTDARRELETAARLARRRGMDYVTTNCLSVLAVLSCEDGAFPAAETMAAAAVELADEHGWTSSPWVSADHVMLGFARLQFLDPGSALHESRRAEAALPADADLNWLRYALGLLTGAALTDSGYRQDGLARMQQARHDHADASVPARLLAAGALIEHRCTLDLGHEALALQLMAWTRERFDGFAEPALMEASRSFAHGALRATEDAVREVLYGPCPPLCPTTRLEARLLETALEIRRDRRTRARDALDAALELAEPMSAIRPFHHADESVRQLLLEQVGGFGRTNDFAARVSQLVSTTDKEPAGVLTSREHAVLIRLSVPQSLDELALDMAVSVNTVKTHLRAIYAKLGVNNRRAAVVAARQQGLS